jgi:hypothetical protein
LCRLRSAQVANKALHVMVAVIGTKWPHGHAIPATTKLLLDQLAVRHAGTGGPILVASRRLNWLAKVGGHLVGRLCHRLPSPDVAAPRSRRPSGTRLLFLKESPLALMILFPALWLAHCSSNFLGKYKLCR